jgi:hypothetical protein
VIAALHRSTGTTSIKQTNWSGCRAQISAHGSGTLGSMVRTIVRQRSSLHHSDRTRRVKFVRQAFAEVNAGCGEAVALSFVLRATPGACGSTIAR